MNKIQAANNSKFAAEALEHMRGILSRTPMLMQHGGRIPSVHEETMSGDRIVVALHSRRAGKTAALEAGTKLRGLLAELVQKGELAMCQDEGPRTWEYKVQHEDMICSNEMHDYVDRDNPIVIAKIGEEISEEFTVPCKKGVKGKKGKKETTKTITKTRMVYEEGYVVFVHISLIRKAKILGISIPSWVKSTDYDEFWVGTAKKESTDFIINWARLVRSARWSIKANPRTVRVIVPKI